MLGIPGHDDLFICNVKAQDFVSKGQLRNQLEKASCSETNGWIGLFPRKCPESADGNASIDHKGLARNVLARR
jgi:hypothetical protein